MLDKFQFETVQEFWQMAGHGPFVWCAYAIFFASIACLYAQARLRRKSMIEKIRLAKRRSHPDTLNSEIKS